VLKGTRPERIEVFLYAKMIGILILGILCNYLEILFLKMFSGAEISETKVARFIISMNIFSGIFKGYLSGTKLNFLSDKYWLKQFCKQKRRRKTTLERIKAQEFFGRAVS
jgi:hypothetical protein